MRKNIVRTAAALVACAGVLSVGGSVYATDLSTSGLNIYNGLGDHITFVRSYDTDNDINEVTVTVLADESNLSAILAQHPGTGSKLSDFYIGFQVESMKDVTPDLVLKDGVWTAKTAGKTNAEIKDEVKAKVDADRGPNLSTTYWPVAVFIEYYNGTDWVKSDATGDGTTTIADDLVAKLSLTDATGLEYGVNYRIGMWTKGYYTFAFKDTSGATAQYEYIKLDIEVKFPVTGTKDDGEAIYYTNLAKAIADGATDIVINEDTDVDDDLTIPAGVTVTVADGATLTIADGKKITVEEGADLRGAGDVEGEVEYIDEGEDEEVDEEENPETGDNIVVALAASGVALAGLLASVVIAKKQ